MGAQQDALRDVEVVESPAPGAPDAGPGADPVLRRRARLRRLWPVLPVAAAALVTGQLVADARERAHVAGLREVPGVVGQDVTAPLRTTPVGSRADLQRLVDGVRAGDLRVAGAEAVAGEPPAVVAVDATTGAEVWRTVVDPRPAPADRIGTPTCAPADAPVTRVVCLVQEQEITAGDDGGRLGAVTASRLVVLDAATGVPGGEEQVAAYSGIGASDELLVVAETEGDGIRVVARDLASGRDRWDVRLPLPGGLADLAGAAPWVSVQDGHVLVRTTARGWSLDPADGAVQVADQQVVVTRGGRLLTWDGGENRNRLRGTDGTGTAEAPAGWPATLAVDDGSVPHLELLDREQTGVGRHLVGHLRAVDAATGATVWERELPGALRSSYLLLEDRLYGADATAVWAVDARDGRELWRTPWDPGAPTEQVDATTWTTGWIEPVTDGRHLVIARERAEGGAVLSTFALGSGALERTDAAPPEIDGHLEVQGHALYGGADEVVRVEGAGA